MRILVLGSGGQVGNPLSKFLESLGHQVIRFDIFDNEKEDLRIPNIIDNILETVDFVYFLSFDVGGSVYLDKYQHTFDFISNNMKIMNNTFDSLKKFNTKFIFASSQMSNMTYSPYGVLKNIGEIYTKILNGRIVKFWNVYGYESDLNKSHVITDFILMAKNNKEIIMRTNGEEERQMLYVDDCCEALVSIMENYDVIDKDKNLHITSFKWEKIIDIANIISKEFNDCLVIPNPNKIDNVQLNKKNQTDEYILNFWRPKTNISDGIKKIITMY